MQDKNGDITEHEDNEKLIDDSIYVDATTKFDQLQSCEAGMRRQMLSDAGYVVFRGTLPPEAVRAARSVVEQELVRYQLRSQGGHLMLSGLASVVDHEYVQALFRANSLRECIVELCSTKSVLPSNNENLWRSQAVYVRCMAPGRGTDVHVDWFRFPIEGVITSWVPLGDYEVDDGVLCVSPGSHRWSEINDRDGDQCENDGLRRGELPRCFAMEKSRWCASSVEMGDVIMFDGRLVHASSFNKSSQMRLSLDVRWWMGTPPAPPGFKPA